MVKRRIGASIKEQRLMKSAIEHRFAIVLIGIILVASVTTVGATMSAFESNPKWSGDVSFAGYLENGIEYPVVLTDAITSDIDGPIRVRNSVGTLNSDQPDTLAGSGITYYDMRGYPTCKPEFTAKIVNNIQHVDDKLNLLQSGVPSVITNENGKLIEIYYYLFSVTMRLDPKKTVASSYYMNIASTGWGTTYIWEVSPLEGFYLIPRISLTGIDSSILTLKSDLATLGRTQYRFYDAVSGAAVSVDSVRTILEDTQARNINQAFYLAGADSSAGLNLYKISGNSTDFLSGFIKLGVPANFYGTVFDSVIWACAWHIWSVEVCIPLRLSVIVTYDIPSTASSVYNWGEIPFVNETNTWFEDNAALSDLNLKVSEAINLPPEITPIFIVVVAVLGLLFLKKRGLL